MVMLDDQHSVSSRVPLPSSSLQLWSLLTCIVLCVLGPSRLLVQHTLLYYNLTCTALICLLYKGIHVYSFIFQKYNTIHSLFLTWYQSHYSNFLVSCSLVLSVFSAVSTSMVSKPFQCPLLTAPPLLVVLRVESPLQEALPPPQKPLPSSGLSPLTSDQATRHINVQIFNLSTHRRQEHPGLTIHAPPCVGQSFGKDFHAPHTPPGYHRSCCRRHHKNRLSLICIIGK